MERLSRYISDTIAEMKHVSWPTRSQAIVYTALVFAISAFVALFVAAFDYAFTNLLNIFI